MSDLVSLRGKPSVGKADTYPQQATIAKSSLGTVVCALVLQTGLKAKLRKVANIVTDVTGGPFITFHLLVNGARWPNFENIFNELSDPARPNEGEEFEDELPQGAVVQLTADNSDAAATHTVVGRIRCTYEDLLS